MIADIAGIKGWSRGNPSAQLAELKASDSMRLDSKVGQIVSSMAGRQTVTSSFNPATTAAMPDDFLPQSVIAAAWHG